jgi:DME family drug/metabolite transporter
LGVALVLAAAALWGTTGTAQALLGPESGTGLAPPWVGAGRLLVAALFFAVLVGLPLLRPGRGSGVMDSGTPLPWRAMVLAAVCMAAYNLAFFAGVRGAGVAVGTAVALGSGPVWAGLLEGFWQRRLPGLGWWLGTAVAVLGVVLMMGLGPGAVSAAAPPPASALVACLMAGLAYAVYTLASRAMVGRTAPATGTALVFVMASLLAVPLAWALAGAPAVSGRALVVVLWLGVASTGVAYWLYAHALRQVAASSAVALALAEPLTAFVLALWVVGEQPGVPALAGLALVVLGLLVLMRHAWVAARSFATDRAAPAGSA